MTMPWATHDHRGTETAAPAAPALIESCWRIQRPARRAHDTASRPISCGIYRAVRGVEVRVGYSDDDILKTEIVPTLCQARELAWQWKAAAIEKGFAEIA